MSQTNLRGKTTSRFGVAFKMISVIVAVWVLIAGIQVFYSYRTSSQNLQLEAERTLSSNLQAYQTKIETEKQTAEALAISIADRPDVQALYLDGDRDGLFELLSPMFEQWKEREIVHLYVENPDGTVFLRVHNPARYGDDITYRGTAATALNEKRTVSGVEIGPSRLGVRAVAPMYSNGQFIGLVEVGLDFDEQFIADLKTITGADFTMWVLFDAAAAPNLRPAEGVPSAPMNELFYYASTDPTLPQAETDLYRQVLETGEPEFSILSANTSTPTMVYLIQLLGYNNKLLGVIQISQPYTTQINNLNTATLSTAGLAGSLTLAGILLFWFITARIVLRPLSILTQVAERQTAGKFDERVSIHSEDEFGQLGKTFNTLAETVEQERRSLEQRVAARTKDLEIVAEVGTAAANILESKRLLQEVVDLTKERFNLYHSHIYLLDDEGKNLVLTAGAGEPGRVMVAEGRSIPLNRESLVARAARERQGVTVNDVTQAPDFLPNPLLPDTRSELAVPMIVGGNVIGVFDIQSEQVGRFTESDVNIQTTLAAQVASSIQNVRVFEQSKTKADLESLVNTIGQKIQRTISVEETLQTAIRELGAAVGASRVRASIERPERDN